ASPTIRNCLIRLSQFHGLNLIASDPVVENCVFRENGGTNAGAFAVVMRTDSLPKFKANTAASNRHDAIGVYGANVNRTGTWVRDNLPYTLTETTYVNSGAQLALEAGSIIQFQADVGFVVDGILTARGAADRPILF